MTTGADIVPDRANADAWAWNEVHGTYRDVVTTWVTDSVLDRIYEDLRQQHYNRKNLRLYKNYSPDHVREVSARSIYWNEEGKPSIVCSILSRSCWPAGTYRILNRLWKPEMNSGPIRGINIGFAKLAIDQTKWCMERGGKTVFMSRQMDGWAKWALPYFNQTTGLEFELPQGRYLTCDDEENDDCWQKILIHGDVSLALNTWKSKDR